jgi:hypothetical protein
VINSLDKNSKYNYIKELCLNARKHMSLSPLKHAGIYMYDFGPETGYPD